MFDLGTKVIVLASTQKTGAGPRKGSIGHVVSVQDGYLVDQTLFASSCTVHFSRFGFEQKSRSEVRGVVNLLQVINNSGDTDIPKQINTFHNFFNSAKLDEAVPRIMDYIQAPPGTTVVIMTPYNEIDDDVLTCDASEFYTWVKMISLVIGPSLYQMTTGSVNIKTDNPLLSKKKISLLNSTLNNRSDRDSYIAVLLESPEERRNFVLTSRYLLSIQNSFSHTSRCKTYRDFIHNDIRSTYSNSKYTLETVRTIYKILYNNLYNISFKRISESLSEKPSRECIKNTILMKSELKSMSEKLFSENTSN